MRAIAFVLAGVAALMGGPLLAADLELPSHPSRVTVFGDGAMVHRNGRLDLPSGSHVLIVRGLPSSLVERSLRVEGKGDFAIGAVDIRRVGAAESARPEERAAGERLQALEDQRSRVAADKTALEMRQRFVTALADGGHEAAPAPAGPGRLEPAHWRSAWEAIQTGYGEAGRALVDKDVELRKLDADIQRAKTDFDTVRSRQRDLVEVRVAVEAEQAGPASLDLTYRVADASWAVVYDLRLDTETGAVAVQQQGAISQRTGEDWTNVSLELSSARTQGATGAPEPGTWWVSPPPTVMVSSASASAPGRVYGSLAPAAAPGGDKAARPRLATVQAGEFLAEFAVPGEVTVTSGTVEKRVVVGESTADSRIELRTVPALDPKAYVTAVLRHDGKTPLLAGQAALYRDGAYVGEAPLKMIAPGEEVSLPFGSDDKVRVRRSVLTDETKQAGGFSSDTVLTRLWRIEVENYHDRPIHLAVFDHLPVSKDGSVEIHPLGLAEKPDRADVDGRVGVIAWDMDMKPAEKRSIDSGFEARWPEGKRPTGL